MNATLCGTQLYVTLSLVTAWELRSWFSTLKPAPIHVSILRVAVLRPRTRSGKRLFFTEPLAPFKKLLTFAFCSPIVRGGRGNGKRVAFGSIAIFGSHELSATR
jgi:hypothetical protein